MKRYEALISTINTLRVAGTHPLHSDASGHACWGSHGMYLPASSQHVSPQDAKRLADWIYYMLEEHDGEFKFDKEGDYESP